MDLLIVDFSVLPRSFVDLPYFSFFTPMGFMSLGEGLLARGQGNVKEIGTQTEGMIVFR